jgi:hypothetical protein
MAAQFPSDEYAVPPFLFLESTWGAGIDALAAGKTLGKIKDRLISLQGNGIFPADLNTGPAPTAVLISNLWPSRTDQSQVGNLGAGAGVGTIGDGYPEFMMHLQGAFHLLLQEGFQVPPGKAVFDPLGKVVIDDHPIRTSARAKASLNLVTLYFVMHLVEKTPLAGFNVFQADFGGPAPRGFFLHPLSYSPADEEGNFG